MQWKWVAKTSRELSDSFNHLFHVLLICISLWICQWSTHKHATLTCIFRYRWTFSMTHISHVRNKILFTFYIAWIDVVPRKKRHTRDKSHYYLGIQMRGNFWQSSVTTLCTSGKRLNGREYNGIALRQKNLKMCEKKSVKIVDFEDCLKKEL